MTMQISVNPEGLTQEQREAVAGFILAYPGRACDHSGVAAEIHDNTEAAQALDNEIAHLAKDGGEFDASVAFGAASGDRVAAAAFGSAPAPLPLGATVAPPLAASIPPAPAPSTVAQPPAGAASVELDKDGLPWDSRIHAESKNKNTDGRWRNKRNLDPAVKAQVDAELRQLMGAPAPLAPPPAVAASPVAPAPTSHVAAQPAAFVAPNPPAAPAVPPPPAAGVAPVMQAAPNAAPGEVPQDARQQFVGLVGRASAAIQGGKVTQAEVTQCCAAAGVPALPLLANRLDLVAQVAAQVDALIASRQ